MPAGLEVTVPVPAPVRITLSANCSRLKVAVTLRAADMVTTHEPVPEHAPLQPANDELESGIATSVTTVAESHDEVQLVPHEMPAGFELTVPPPVPAFETVRGNTSRVNVAPTAVAIVAVTTHAAVPVQAPVHPVKVEPTVGVAVNVTIVPATKLAEQVTPQSRPAGVEVTTPVPVPLSMTDTATCLS